MASLRALLLCCLLPACTFFDGDDRVLVTSTPAGARILLDGEDTGRTTPAMVALGGIMGGDHEFRVHKRGFDPESRRVVHYTRSYAARWIDGATEPELWALPLWWPLGDWVLPLGVRWIYVPHELHVQLYPEGTAPVTAPGSDGEARGAQTHESP